jgi:hypothetical protein
MRKLNVWVIFRRPEPGIGEWEAHVLDLDVVTYGLTLAHAVEMAMEAARMVVVDDLQAGGDPSKRRAPDEEWQEMYDLQERASHGVGAKLRTLGDLIKDPATEKTAQRVAVNLEVEFEVESDEAGSVEGLPDRGMALSECA